MFKVFSEDERQAVFACFDLSKVVAVPYFDVVLVIIPVVDSERDRFPAVSYENVACAEFRARVLSKSSVYRITVNERFTVYKLCVGCRNFLCNERSEFGARFKRKGNVALICLAYGRYH